MLKLLARQILGTCSARYPCSRCRYRMAAETRIRPPDLPGAARRAAPLRPRRAGGSLHRNLRGCHSITVATASLTSPRRWCMDRLSPTPIREQTSIPSSRASRRLAPEPFAKRLRPRKPIISELVKLWSCDFRLVR